MNKFTLTSFFFLLINVIFAQEKLSQEVVPVEQQEEKVKLSSLKVDGLKITGYIQTQWQYAQQEGVEAFASCGAFELNSDNRFSIRRGRLKISYTTGIMTMVVQPDFTEKGVNIKDIYLNLTGKSKVIGGQVGLFDRPFGYEISYSSSKRESPERSRVFLTLFPGEREVGAMFVLKGKEGLLQDFTLNAGLFNGNGIGKETDSRKDFIGRLAYLKKSSNLEYGAAFSYYNGGVLNPVLYNYSYQKGIGYVQSVVEADTYSKREYFGVGAQVLYKGSLGKTNVRAEYLWGTQPGTYGDNANPGGSSFGAGSLPLYQRNFRGGYVIVAQDIAKTKHSLVFKYDYFDPNIEISGDEIGDLGGTTAADIAYNTFGVGYTYSWTKNIKTTAYYDIVLNETSKNLMCAEPDSDFIILNYPIEDFTGHIKQDIFTLRVQYMF